MRIRNPGKYFYTEDFLKDPANIQSKHQAFEAELAANAEWIQSLLAMGQNLIDQKKCSGSEEAVQGSLMTNLAFFFYTYEIFISCFISLSLSIYIFPFYLRLFSLSLSIYTYHLLLCLSLLLTLYHSPPLSILFYFHITFL